MRSASVRTAYAFHRFRGAGYTHPDL